MTQKILRELIAWLVDHAGGYILPNYYIDDWEADVLNLSQLGYTTEYEIKVSRADYKKDFEKAKTRYNRRARQRITKNKHDEIEQGSRTNKFYFVTPPGLLKAEDLPKHIGLIEINLNPHHPRDAVKIIQNAKFLHRDKVSTKIYMDIMDKFYNRYMFQYYMPKLNRQISLTRKSLARNRLKPITLNASLTLS